MLLNQLLSQVLQITIMWSIKGADSNNQIPPKIEDGLCLKKFLLPVYFTISPSIIAFVFI